jgi:biofilm PGA synthesis N-glycosyltransferase PgaC
MIPWWEPFQLYVMVYPVALCAITMATALIHVLRHETVTEPAADEMPSVAILVPACNEERVLEETLHALLALDWPLLEIHVLSDGSTDGTVEIARTFAPERVQVAAHAVNRGKSAVLQDALAALTTDLVMIVDADTRLEPSAVGELAACFVHPDVGGATANVRVAGARSLLMRLQQMEYATIIGLVKRANGFWGGLFTVSGAAACFRVAAVRAVGGFQSRSATEDIELSWRLQRAGWRLVYAPRAKVFIEVPARLRALWRQRRRWASGLTEVLRLHGALWRGPHAAARVLAPFVAEAVCSIVWSVLLVASIATFVVQWALTGTSAALAPGFWQWQIFTVAMFLAQSFTAWLIDRHYAREPAWLLALALIYPLYFLVFVLPANLAGWTIGLFTQQAQRWQRTERA